MKETVIGPNAGFDLFVYLNNIRCLFTCFELLCCLMEFPILGKHSTWLSLWLVECFGIRNSFAFRLIMPFVNEHRPIILHLVLIGSIGTNRH